MAHWGGSSSNAHALPATARCTGIWAAAGPCVARAKSPGGGGVIDGAAPRSTAAAAGPAGALKIATPNLGRAAQRPAQPGGAARAQLRRPLPLAGADLCPRPQPLPRLSPQPSQPPVWCNPGYAAMGRHCTEFLEGRLYCCRGCKQHVALHAKLISRCGAFQVLAAACVPGHQQNSVSCCASCSAKAVVYTPNAAIVPEAEMAAEAKRNNQTLPPPHSQFHSKAGRAYLFEEVVNALPVGNT